MGYLDDIIIYSRSEKEHLEHLEEIFIRLKAAGLKFKLEKCCFFKKHIQYLGHLISAEGIQPLPEKLKSIAKMPAPKKPKRSETIPWSSRIRPQICRHLKGAYTLNEKGHRVQVDPQPGNCFQILKEFLQQEPVAGQFPSFYAKTE